AAGLLATKRVIVTADGFKIEEYSRMRHFRAATVTFDNIEDVYRLLHLDPRPRSFVIRAMLRDGIAPDRVRRTLHPDPTTGEPAFFRPVRRAWAAFDWDSVPPPSGLDPVRE